MAMRQLWALAGVLAFTPFASGQSSDQLSPSEISAALANKSGSGYVYIEDSGFTTPSRCTAQAPSLGIYTPAGWLKAFSDNARRQYRPFTPSADDTLRVLRIISLGCASGTSAGPLCETISRAALLSDLRGRVVAEAVSNVPLPQSWQNGFGATAACSALASKFLMSDVQKVQNKNGEFIVATFYGSQLLKTYTVKEKHLKKLELPHESAASAGQPSTSSPTSAPPPTLVDGLKINSEAAQSSPAAAASLATVGRIYSQQELAELAKNGQASRCAIVTFPPGGEIEIDGNRMGVAPVAFYLLRQGDTPRMITIKMSGYKTVQKSVVPDGRVIPIAVTMERE